MTQSRRIDDPRPWIPLVTALLMVGALIALPAAGTATPQQHEEHAADEDQGDGGSMMTDCQAMMAKRQQMMERQEAMDAELDALLGAVRDASGDAKVDAMEALLERLVSQRRTMRSMMTEGHGAMMAHMMGHMGTMHQKGEMMTGEGGMKMCPMMQKMMSGEGDDTEKTDHSSHHPG